MNFLLRLFLTVSSVSFFVIVFLIYNKLYPYKYELDKYWWIVLVVYILVPFLATGLAIMLCKLLSSDSLSHAKKIETSNNDFLANYLSFFFVALSLDAANMILFWVVFGMTILFTFFSRVSYFNPMFLIFGFNFYYVETSDDAKVMLITRKKLKKPSDLNASIVRRINDYTFIEF